MHLQNLKNTFAALLLGLGLVAGGITIAMAGPSVSLGHPSTLHDDGQPTTPCAVDSNDASASPAPDNQDANDKDNEGDSNESDKQEGDEHEGEHGTPEADGQTGDHRDEGDDCEVTGAPGELVEGQDLQSQATITIDQAISTAQGAATGDLGTVTLDDETGTLVYEVEIGDQDVVIDATTGAVVDTNAQDDNN